jgi:hypothetical protein
MEIIADREGLTVSEYVRALILEKINQEFEDQLPEDKPAAFYLRNAKVLFEKGLEKLEKEYPDFTLDKTPL